MIGRKSPPPPEEDQSLRGFDDFELCLGDMLRGERATLGKSLLDVQRELKIKANYIAAIESADATAFETPGFIAGYVRSYARYLGMDPDWAFAKFCEESQFNGAQGLAAEPSFGARPQAAAVSAGAKGRARVSTKDPLIDTRAPFAPSGQSVLAGVEPGALGSVMVLLVLIGGLIYGGWAVLRQVQQVNVVPVDDAPLVVAELDPLSGAGVAAMQGETGSQGEGLDRLYRPEALDVPVLVARDGPISELDPESVGTLARTAAPRLLTQAPDTPLANAMASVEATPTAPSPAAPGDGVRVLADAAPGVELFAVRPAWVRVTGADGSVVFEKILDTGERYTLPRLAQAPQMRAGNSGSVYFIVDGRTFGPAGPGTSVAKGVKLGVEDITSAYAVADMAQDPDLARAVAELAAQ